MLVLGRQFLELCALVYLGHEQTQFEHGLTAECMAILTNSRVLLEVLFYCVLSQAMKYGSFISCLNPSKHQFNGSMHHRCTEGVQSDNLVRKKLILIDFRIAK